MPKTIILLCDGSWDYWNSLYPSNVRILSDIFSADEHKKLLNQQIQIIYMDGFTVSDSDWVDDFNGILRNNVNKIIAEVYCQLCLTYDQGDHVSIFGNSRGAFIARSLVGFVRRYGLLKKEVYRYSEIELMKTGKELFEQFHRDNYNSPNMKKIPLSIDIMKAYSIRIDYLGILETIPGIAEDRLRSHDVFAHTDIVHRSCHIMATDTTYYYENLSYHSTVEEGFNRCMDYKLGNHVEYRLKGNHGNVVGGYVVYPQREICISNVALRDIIAHSPFRILLTSNIFATKYPIPSSEKGYDPYLKSVLNPAMMTNNECECMFLQVSQQIAMKLGQIRPNITGTKQFRWFPLQWFFRRRTPYKTIPVGIGNNSSRIVYASDELAIAVSELNAFQLNDRYTEEGIFLWSYLRSEFEDLIYDGKFFALELEDMEPLCNKAKSKHVEATIPRTPSGDSNT